VCGSGMACCRKNWIHDPAECNGAVDAPVSEHACVRTPTVAAAEAEAAGANTTEPKTDCWYNCGNKGGLCPGFCGEGRACCRESYTWDPPECKGARTKLTQHQCVEATSVIATSDRELPAGAGEAAAGTVGAAAAGTAAATVLVSEQEDTETTRAPLLGTGEDCWYRCGEKGGNCPEACGVGKACCKTGFPSDPPVCAGAVMSSRFSRHHECVTPATSTTTVAASGIAGGAAAAAAKGSSGAEGVTNKPALLESGMDCWYACGKKGGICPEACGEGKSCCKQGFADDPVECRGLPTPSSSHHICVDQFLGPDQDCWGHCSKKSGLCDLCGAGKACCRTGWNVTVPECQNVQARADRHTCVASGMEEPSTKKSIVDNGTKCINGTNASDGENGTLCGVPVAASSAAVPWWLWPLLAILCLLCCLIPLFVWLCCKRKKGKRSKSSSNRRAKKFNDADSTVSEERELLPLMDHQTEARELHTSGGQQMDAFDMIDRNHDGVITQSELNAAMGQQTQPAVAGLQAPSLAIPSLNQPALGFTAPGLATGPPAFATTPPVPQSTVRLGTPSPMQTQVLQAPLVQPTHNPVGTTAFVQAASPKASASMMQPGLSSSFSPQPTYAMSPAAVSTMQPPISTIQPGVSTFQQTASMQPQMQVQHSVHGSFVQPGVVSTVQYPPQLSGGRVLP